MSPAQGPRRVLLVHGAWEGAWCWQPLLAPLRELGYQVDAIDLPGHGGSHARFTDLHGDADAVRAHLHALGEPTVLVGHSYGGMVITDAGSHDEVTALIYVCAFLPSAGQSAVDLLSQPPPAGEPTSELFGSIRDDGTVMHLEGDGLADVAFADCKPEIQQWALEHLGAQPTASVTQPARQLGWTSKPTTYVVCTEDRIIPSWLQRSMAVNADSVVELRASHSPFLSMPDQLARVINQAVHATE